MQVNVFVSEPRQNETLRQLLLLPYGLEAVIPPHLRGIDWRYLATTQADDKLIDLPTGEVDVAMVSDGYVVVTHRATVEREAQVGSPLSGELGA